MLVPMTKKQDQNVSNEKFNSSLFEAKTKKSNLND